MRGASAPYGAGDVELVLEGERRRLAADVHDLVMQDLSFALARARAIVEDPARARADAQAAVSAGERALAGARRMLATLDAADSRPTRETVEDAVRTAARDVELSFDAAVPDAARCERLTLALLVHVAREAVTNAIKHAAPTRVAVVLAHERGWLLVVTNDGDGFDPVRHPAGFGLASMRSQAAAVGGRLSVMSAPHSGTVVELVLP